MRISDWSSDVCSSDLQTAEIDVTGIVDRIGAGDAFAAGVLHAHLSGGDARALAETGLALTCLKHSLPGDASRFGQADIDAFHGGGLDVRSEESRVGKEGVSTCRSRWSP